MPGLLTARGVSVWRGVLVGVSVWEALLAAVLALVSYVALLPLTGFWAFILAPLVAGVAVAALTGSRSSPSSAAVGVALLWLASYAAAVAALLLASAPVALLLPLGVYVAGLGLATLAVLAAALFSALLAYLGGLLGLRLASSRRGGGRAPGRGA